MVSKKEIAIMYTLSEKRNYFHPTVKLSSINHQILSFKFTLTQQANQLTSFVGQRKMALILHFKPGTTSTKFCGIPDADSECVYIDSALTQSLRFRAYSRHLDLSLYDHLLVK